MFNLNLLPALTHENILAGVTIDFHVISMMRSVMEYLINKFRCFAHLADMQSHRKFVYFLTVNLLIRATALVWKSEDLMWCNVKYSRIIS